MASALCNGLRQDHRLPMPPSERHRQSGLDDLSREPPSWPGRKAQSRDQPIRYTLPVCIPSTLFTYPRAASDAGTGFCPGKNGPNADHDSSVTVGLTTLMRTPRGSSIATLRANASSPPLTIAPDAPTLIGSSLICPVVNVNDPPLRICFRPKTTRFTWPISLLCKPIWNLSCVNSASGPK